MLFKSQAAHPLPARPKQPIQIAGRLRRRSGRPTDTRVSSPLTTEAFTEGRVKSGEEAAARTTAVDADSVNHHTLRWNWKWGSSITYTRAGCTADDGRPALLLLHGFGVSRQHFVHNIPALAQQYKVYAVDLLGHGGSWPSQPSCEQSGPLHYNVATYTEQLHCFIQQQIQQPVYIAGNSLGGFLAANLAVQHPDAVSGVVLLNAAPYSAPHIPGRQSALWRLLTAAADNTPPERSEQVVDFIRSFWWDLIRQPGAIRLILQLVYARHAAIDEQLVQCILEPTHNPQALDAFISMVVSPSSQLSFDELLQRMQCPVCLAYGRDDPWISPMWGRRAKRHLPRAVYLELTPAGHCPHHEAPTAVNHIITTFVEAVEAGQHHNCWQHELLQAGSSISYDEGDNHIVQVYCIDGQPRGVLQQVDAAMWQVKQQLRQELRRLLLQLLLLI